MRKENEVRPYFEYKYVLTLKLNKVLLDPSLVPATGLQPLKLTRSKRLREPSLHRTSDLRLLRNFDH
jgi:hypothetical protein